MSDEATHMPDITALKALLEDITNVLPWSPTGTIFEPLIDARGNAVICVGSWDGKPTVSLSRNNRHYIAAACNAVPELLKNPDHYFWMADRLLKAQAGLNEAIAKLEAQRDHARKWANHWQKVAT
ncbi:MAG: hypothetical protein JWO59_690 [Chloroflexi bacterium]|nr:hypothetical protein [Chloroflexota bacterium]